MRSAGCIINDIWDRKIDAQVERTKNRPLASGALKLYHAILLLIICLFIGLFTFLELNLLAQKIALGAFALAILYPAMKRFFPLPQLFLGTAFNLGALIAWATINNSVDLGAILLYIAGILWTLGYDTIYGHQDIKDDKKIGIKSTPITFGKYSKAIITTCLLSCYILIISAGYSENLDFISITMLPVLINFTLQIRNLKLESPESCLAKFQQNAYITGFLISLGLYLAKLF